MDINARYNEVCEYLFGQLPMFSRDGASAYKPGLQTALMLSSAFGAPHRHLGRVIHIAGTNGKGSTSHMIAAVLQSAGYKTALFTSPHLVDFRERIRIDGQMIDKASVVDFVNRYLDKKANGSMGDVSPSFFELTTIMAMEYFAREKVDFTVLETGLGGLLDTTNIVEQPLLAIVTNISLDHTAQLGSTLAEIATQKAGIVKPGVPLVVGAAPQPEVRDVFVAACNTANSPLVFADASFMSSGRNPFDAHFTPELQGDFQRENISTVLNALELISCQGVDISATAVEVGMQNVSRLTGLRARWETIGRNPLMVCDTGHNPGAWQYIGPGLEQMALTHRSLYVVLGFVADKDVDTIIDTWPKAPNIHYVFTQPDSHRRLAASDLCAMAARRGIEGKVFDDVHSAMQHVRRCAGLDDAVFIGGSNYLVSQVLANL